MAKTIYPETSEILNMIESADSTDDKTRDPRRFYKVLEKVPDVNSRVAGHLNVRGSALAACGWRFRILDKAYEKKIPEVTARLAASLNTIVKNHALCHAYGHQVYTVNWKLLNDFQIPSITAAEVGEYECYKGNFFKFEGNNKYKVDKSPNLLLNSTTVAKTSGGILRSIMLTEALRIETLKEQANIVKKVKGLLQFINKGGDAGKVAAEQAASQAIANSVFITDDLIEFKLNQLVSSNASLKTILDDFKADIAIAFLGQANTTELPKGGGSRAALQVLKLISADITWSDIIHLEDFVNTQILKYDFNLNYDDGEPLYAFQIALEEDIDMETNGNGIQSMLNTGLPFKKNEIYAKTPFSIPNDEDFANNNVIQIPPNGGI